MGAGVETEVPRPGGFPSSLHVFFGGALPPGYGWAFGSGGTLRVGLKSALNGLLAELGLEPESTHGGLIPLRSRPPVLGEPFIVGDAAGQVLPVSAEGIRPALHYGHLVGRLLGEALAGRLEPSEARTPYARALRQRRWGYRALGRVQGLLASRPDLTGAILKALTHAGVSQPIYRCYLYAMCPSADAE